MVESPFRTGSPDLEIMIEDVGLIRLVLVREEVIRVVNNL